MDKRWFYVVAVIVVALLVARTSLFVVDETRLAIVTQFGDPVRVVEEAGLHWKMPQPVQAARFFDKRLLVYDPKPTEFLTNDKKNIVADTFVAWKIQDPRRFLETVTDRAGAEVRMADIVASEVGAALGRYPLHALISVDPEQMKIAAIMDTVTAGCSATASASFGIDISEVRMKRLAFPEQNKQSVFDRMRAERSRIAMRYRSEGEEEAIRIRAEADRERQEILAEAYREAETIRGRGDAEAAKVYAEAFSADPDFYEFTRKLESYGKFLDEKTTVILSSDSDLLDLLNRKER
ncbi:MAG: protease modulator HflC [Candidatus Eisenbacteria bacterium]|nr:protease modulator HflC [Candidatus Eisenbacteria bacterium]